MASQHFCFEFEYWRSEEKKANNKHSLGILPRDSAALHPSGGPLGKGGGEELVPMVGVVNVAFAGKVIHNVPTPGKIEIDQF
jgi:hypothetical protein